MRTPDWIVRQQEQQRLLQAIMRSLMRAGIAFDSEEQAIASTRTGDGLWGLFPPNELVTWEACTAWIKAAWTALKKDGFVVDNEPRLEPPDEAGVFIFGIKSS